MKCPECVGEVWALFSCDDGRHRCWQCKATGRGRIVTVQPPEIDPVDTAERPYITRKKRGPKK